MEMTKDKLFNEIMQQSAIDPTAMNALERFDALADYMQQADFEAKNGYQPSIDILKSVAMKELFHDVSANAITYLNNHQNTLSAGKKRLSIELLNIRFENPPELADEIVDTAYLPALAAYSKPDSKAQDVVNNFINGQQEEISRRLVTADLADQRFYQLRMENLQAVQKLSANLETQAEHEAYSSNLQEEEAEEIRQRESLHRFGLSKECEEYFIEIYHMCRYDEPAKLADMTPFQAFDILGEHLLQQCDWVPLEQDQTLASKLPPVASELCKSLTVQAVNYLNKLPDNAKALNGDGLDVSLFHARCSVENRNNLLFMEAKHAQPALGQFRSAESDHADVKLVIELNNAQYRLQHKGKIPEDAVHTFVKERSKDVTKKLYTTFSHTERQYLRAKKENLKQIKELHVNKQREALGLPVKSRATELAR